MNFNVLLHKLEGIQTIDSIMNLLGVSRSSAYVYVSLLRKEGFVKTKYMSNKKRVYYISKKNRLGGTSYVEIINKYSPVKLAESETYKIYGRDVSFEETLIFAIKTKKIRFILASLVLFQHITDWRLLGDLARKNSVERFVGALYDMSRKIMKTRKMEGKFRNSILPSSKDTYTSVIEGLQSKDFKLVEDYWHVHLPFNKLDLEVYAS